MALKTLASESGCWARAAMGLIVKLTNATAGRIQVAFIVHLNAVGSILVFSENQRELYRKNAGSRKPVGRLTLFNIDKVTHHPDFKLLEARLPAALKFLHPFAALGCIGHVHHQPYQIVTIDYATLTPLSLQ